MGCLNCYGTVWDGWLAQHLFLIVLETGKFKVEVPADKVFGEIFLSETETDRQKDRDTGTDTQSLKDSLMPFYKSTNPFLGFTIKV